MIDKDDLQAELWKAYVSAFAEMQNALKDKKNPHLGNDYATLESVLAAVRPVLAKYGLAILQAPADMRALTAGGGVRLESTAAAVDTGVTVISVITTLAHQKGGTVTIRTEVPVAPQVDKKTGRPVIDAQRAGSAITYARRYALAAVCGITQTDDDGSAASAYQSVDTGSRTQLADKLADAATLADLERMKDEVRQSGDRALIQLYVERKKELS